MKSQRQAQAGKSQTAKRETFVKEQAVKMKTCTFAWPMTPDARAVQLAGDFTNWTPIPLKKDAHSFHADVQLPPGEYRYKFIVDGEWHNDPAAAELVPNGFGTTDSVLHV